MNQSCLQTMLCSGSTLAAFIQVECMASYSSAVTVYSSGSSTSKATVRSASLLTMQPFSTESRGNLRSSVSAFNTFLMIVVFFFLQII